MIRMDHSSLCEPSVKFHIYLITIESCMHRKLNIKGKSFPTTIIIFNYYFLFLPSPSLSYQSLLLLVFLIPLFIFSPLISDSSLLPYLLLVFLSNTFSSFPYLTGTFEPVPIHKILSSFWPHGRSEALTIILRDGISLGDETNGFRDSTVAAEVPMGENITVDLRQYIIRGNEQTAMWIGRCTCRFSFPFYGNSRWWV